MTEELATLDATAQARLVASGDASPLELVDAAIARIERVDGELNAVNHRTFESARATAQSGDLPDGPFRGVPFLLKDLWPSSAGDPMTMGVRALKDADYRAEVDSNIVTRYREAGFVLLGRTNSPELGLVATTEPLAFGPTRNPWNVDHGPGGSSGGAAAAVAAGLVPVANASDGGGSIRIPAAMCGLVGLKPSRGRISMGPTQEEWGLSVQHVVSRTVRDSAAILDATSGPFPGDGVVAPASGRPYAAEVGADPGRLRIGLLEQAPSGEIHDECVAAVVSAGATLERLGHDVVSDHPAGLFGGPDDSAGAFTALWAAGAAASLRTIGAMLGREVGPDDVEPGTWMLAEMAGEFSAADVISAQNAMGRARRDLAAWWDGGFDLLLTPTTAMPPPPLGQLTPTDEDPFRGLYASIPYATFTSPFNMSGQPAISLPTHRTVDDLPVGVQLVAAYGRENQLLAVASQMEAAGAFVPGRPPVHA